jgi:cytoskeletal protein CcmA (bactofilin family)
MSTAKVINIVHPSGTITNLVNDANGGIVIGGTLTANANVTVNGTSTFTGTLTAGNINITGNVTGNLTIAGTMTTANSNVIGTVVMSSSFKRNRIINGNMVVDQRNAGANVTPTAAVYTIDRWQTQLTQSSKFSIQQNAGSVTPPSGYTNYIGITSLSAYSVLSTDYFALVQSIEGFNIADFGWGAAGASSVTLSFWVRSSLTGTFGGVFTNSAYNRSYPFNYTISSANTWEQKTVTVAGDTSGTWLKDNSAGVRIFFNLGAGATYSGTSGSWSGSTFTAPTVATSVVGTSGATFYVTGVQLEVGTKATPYEMQIYSDQLAQCQRYYAKSYDTGTVPGATTSSGGVGSILSSGGSGYTSIFYKVSMRTTPTVVVYNASTGGTGTWSDGGGGSPATSVNLNGINGMVIYSSGGSASSTILGHYTASAEL